MASVRVAVWQVESRPGDVAGNLARLRAACERAAGEGADVLVTPEMFTTGYNIGAAATAELAEPPDGETARAVADIGRNTGVAVLYGYPERGDDGRLYNAAQLLDGERTVTRYRKTHLFGELDGDRFAPGAALPEVVSFRGHPLAVMICYDVEFPELVRSAALRGAATILVPTANMAGYELASTAVVRARAYENGVNLVYNNFCGSEDGLVYTGLSVACAADGRYLVEPVSTSEEFRVVELSVPGASPFLTDRRADLYG